jgi:hypothetical protein
MTGIAGCWACAASGHAAAAPPRSDMNSRRRIQPPRLRARYRIELGSATERGHVRFVPIADMASIPSKRFARGRAYQLLSFELRYSYFFAFAFGRK